jgi:hypothetical protein
MGNKQVVYFAIFLGQLRRALTTPVKFPPIGERKKSLSANNSNLRLPDKSCHAVIGCKGLFHGL